MSGELEETPDPRDSLLTVVETDFPIEQYLEDHRAQRKYDPDAYGDYEHLEPLFKKYTKTSDSVLVIGGENVSIANHLALNGTTNTVVIDPVGKKVNSLKKRHSAALSQGLKLIQMDPLYMEFEDQEFSLIIDRNGVDSVYLSSDDTGDLSKSTENLGERLKQIVRVLRNYGRYIFLSTLEGDLVHFLIEWFRNEPTNTWIIRLYRWITVENAYRIRMRRKGFIKPIFAVVAFRLPLHAQTEDKIYIETTFSVRKTDFEPKRFEPGENLNLLYDTIKTIHKLMVLANHLRYSTLKDEEICLRIYSVKDSVQPRYHLFITDFPDLVTVNHEYAIFIVPEGRETEWLFGTAEGRKQLAKTSKCSRLTIVHLGRQHYYHGGLERIQRELSGVVMYFAQEKVYRNFEQRPVSFLSIDDDMGKRVVVTRGHSEMSGDYVVEDVTVKREYFRRLIFMKSQNIIQSEARLKVFMRPQCDKYVLDSSYISCHHHSIFFTGISIYHRLLANADTHRMCLIGLGGGCFVNYLQQSLHLPGTVELDVVEIDPEMEKIAKKFFFLNPQAKKSFHVNISIQDGLEFISEAALGQTKSYHIIMFDVNSDDQLGGLSCPPEPFVEEAFLQQVYSILDESTSIFMVNVVTRVEARRQEIEERLKKLFICIYRVKVPEDVNVVYWCIKSPFQVELIIGNLYDSKKAANLIGTVMRSKNLLSELIDVNNIGKYISKVE